MDKVEPLTAVFAKEVPLRSKPSNYPEPFASQMQGREKRVLGKVFGLTNFGVNLTRLAPGAVSALRHAHAVQDEFVYVLSGQPTLVTDAGRQQLAAGMCVGFRAGTGDAHQLINETQDSVEYLEVGDRMSGDSVHYPDDDIQAVLAESGEWQFLHKDGSSYS